MNSDYLNLFLAVKLSSLAFYTRVGFFMYAVFSEVPKTFCQPLEIPLFFYRNNSSYFYGPPPPPPTPTAPVLSFP